ncbi:hypothetical protein ACLB2K_027974 [Fragaria x ananassa]
MEGEEGPTDASIVAVPTATDSTPPPSLPHDSDVSTDQAAYSGLTEDLKQKIIKQVEYYFSDENLPNDKYMLSLIKKNKEGFARISCAEHLG